MDIGRMTIRQAEEADVLQIAQILVEDWKIAYRGIIDGAFLDAMNVKERYERELCRYRQYTVAARGREVLGFIWAQAAEDEAADCEIVALYVRYAERKSGVGRALFRHAADGFRAAGKKRMIVWCLEENAEARRFI